MTKEQVEGNKTIAEFMGIDVYEGYRIGEHVEYTVKGLSVQKWRDNPNYGLVGGYEEKMLLTNTKFHSSLHWLLDVYEVIREKKSDVVGDVSVEITFQENGNYKVLIKAEMTNQWKGWSSKTPVFFVGSDLAETMYHGALQFINWFNDPHKSADEPKAKYAMRVVDGKVLDPMKEHIKLLKQKHDDRTSV